MIELRFQNKNYTYDVYHIVKSFLPGQEISQVTDETEAYAVQILADGAGGLYIERHETESIPDKKMCKNYVNKKVYQWLSQKLKKDLAWGILTGIRPTKIIMELLDSGLSVDEVRRYFHEHYLVSREKTELGLAIAIKEKALLEKLDYKNGYSLYIGIPFCPTTCAYCSFTSYPISLWKDRTELYLQALFKELSYVSGISKDRKLNTIYVGGGTPTTLSAVQLDRLLTHLEQNFSYEDLKEITVEAGRPDSITEDKLKTLRRHGIGRISINPQTMQQKTLDIIGRKHSAESVKEAFHLARAVGFTNINMDLIAGLPGETHEDMEDTLEQISLLDPDSITVHALAVKRASRFGQQYRERLLHGGQDEDGQEESDRLSGMIDLSARYAARLGMEPYYLYRQKNIAGNFENVGYAKVDKAGIYNILIMEEKQSIVAVGAGASTKAVYPEALDGEGRKNSRIVRAENVKDVAQYIERIDEMIERKGELLWH